MIRALPRLLWLLVLAGCASAGARAPMAEGGGSDGSLEEREQEAQQHDLDGKVRRPKAPKSEDLPGDDEPPTDPDPKPTKPLTKGPYDKRSGARGKAAAKTPPREVRFVLRKPLPKPVVAGRRPALDGRYKLAVAFVRKGRLVTDAARLLRLETRLSDDDAVRSVASVARPKGSTVDLDGLARLARRAGRALLLVSVETAPEAAAKETLVRRGWLLFTQAGKRKDRVRVLARYDVHRSATIPASGGSTHTGLLARLERAHARLED